MTENQNSISAESMMQYHSIPKIVHLVWLGDNPFPPEVKRCLESWVRYLSGYKIRIWRAEDTRPINCEYLRQALSEKKWAFATDVVRFYALYTEGGIYMDADILLYKSFEHIIPDEGFATFHEHIGSKIQLQAAMMMGSKGNIICKDAFEYYCCRNFRREDGSLDLTVSPAVLADVASRHGWVKKDTLQHFGSEMQTAVVYPGDMLTPHNHARNENPDAIGRHCILGSWRKRKFGRHLEIQVKRLLHRASYNISHLSPSSRKRIFDIRTHKQKYFSIP